MISEVSISGVQSFVPSFAPPHPHAPLCHPGVVGSSSARALFEEVLREGRVVAIPFFKVLQFDILVKFCGEILEECEKTGNPQKAITQPSHKEVHSFFPQGGA